jgi:hypothetical protein
MRRIISFICVALMLICSACTKDHLPAETQTGAGTFGCKLNGNVWIPKGSDGYSGQNTKRQFSYGGCFFLVSATDHDSNPLTGFVIGFDSTCMTVGVPIKLASGRNGEGGARYFTIGYSDSDNKDFITNDSLTGELIFTKYNPPITSGKFWFDAMDKSGQVIHVTEGRFDIQR